MPRNTSKRQANSGDESDSEQEHSTTRTKASTQKKSRQAPQARKRARSDKQEILVSSSTRRSTASNHDDNQNNSNNSGVVSGSAQSRQDDDDFEEEDNGFADTHVSPFQSKGTVAVGHNKTPLRRVSDLRSTNNKPSGTLSETVTGEDNITPLTRINSRATPPTEPFDGAPSPNQSPLPSRTPSRSASPVDPPDIDPEQPLEEEQVVHRNRDTSGCVGRKSPKSDSEPSPHGFPATAWQRDARPANWRTHACSAVGTPAERVISKVEYKDNVKPSIKVKPKESDYSGTTAKILSQALLRYQIKIQTEDAFPSHETQQLWARTVFGQSCKEYEREYGTEGEHINRIYRLIMNRASTCRGHVRDKVCSKIGETFALKHDTSDEASVQYNATRVAWLLESTTSRYCHAEYAADPRPRHLGQVPIVTRVLQEVSFNRGIKSTGVLYRASFDPLPLPTIALLLTMIRYGLERWKTGRQESTRPEFRETLYKEIYTDHLRRLDDWVKLDPIITTKIRADMYQKVLRLGGIDLSEELPTGLSEADKQNALADLADYAERNTGLPSA